MRLTPSTIVLFSSLVTGCASAPAPAGHGPTTARPAGPISFFVRAEHGELLLGTLAPDGTLVRNPALPAGNGEADAAMVSSVRLAADGRPVPHAGSAEEGGVTWSLGDDGSLRCAIAAPAEMEMPPMVFRRGFDVLADGRAVQPALGVSYTVRDDGSVVQRFRDGREEVEPRWRVQGASGTDRRRTMVALVILDDFFDAGGGMLGP